MSKTYDVVIAGAGSNSLTAAGYLAKAGLSVCVLEKNDRIGGGVVSQELTAPGFRHDPHATGMILIMANPLLRNDELGLKSRFGLKFVSPEATYTTLFDDETWMGTYISLDKTCASIARFSQKDADTYRALATKTIAMAPLLTAGMFKPPLPFGQFMAMLDQSPVGQELIASMLKSGTALIRELFEHEKVRMHFMKWLSEGMVHPDERGTGVYLYFLTAVAHTQEETAVVGGSQAMSDAMGACIRHYGGEIRTGTQVVRVLNSGGVARGVELADGEQVLAKKAVIACIHPWNLGDMVPGLDADMVAEARRCELSSFGAINTHWALHQAPNYKCPEVNKSLLVECMPARMADLRAALDAVRNGRLAAHFNAVVAHHTNHDPTRAPAGKHTLYLYCFAPLQLDGGWTDKARDDYRDWMIREYAKFCTNMGESNLIARAAESPADMARWSASFQNGDIFGIGNWVHQYLGRRPTPRLAQYAVPGAKGLYLAGPFMHPGGAVTGGGRATAMKIMGDLGIDVSRHMAL
jgi:phytoene dehydrogenase-like protein